MPRRHIEISKEDALLACLRSLLARQVPMAVGGAIPGPMDEVAWRIEQGQLDGPFVALSWTGPQAWTLRQHLDGVQVWRETTNPAGWVSLDFSLY